MRRLTPPEFLPSVTPRAGYAAHWARLLGVAVGYVLLAFVVLSLAAPSGYASPIYPPAGLALAAALVFGRSACFGVLLGAACVHTLLVARLGHVAAPQLLAAAAMGIGSAIQAGVGALLVRRWVKQPLVLNAPRDVLRFGLLGAVASTLISPSWGVTILTAMGFVPAAESLHVWLTWWMGDVIGVLIGAPMALAFIGEPAVDWRPRRRTVALPLLIAMALLALGVAEFRRIDQQRVMADFQRDADRLASEAQLRLGKAAFALQALYSLGLGESHPDHARLTQTSRWWLAQNAHPQGLGHSERMGADAVVVHHIEPASANPGVLGSDEMGMSAARQAILSARDSGLPVTSAPILLPTDSGPQVGVVLYQALYDGQPADPPSRRNQFRGVVFVRAIPDRDLVGLVQKGQQHLRWCLLDPAAPAGSRRLAGPQGCELAGARASAFNAQRSLDLGGRLLDLRIDADVAAMPGKQDEGAWLLALTGLCASALLGALLLVITGHSRRTQLAVQLGTAALRREMADRTQAEEELRESEARLRTILDNVPLGVLFLDPQGFIIECNPHLCHMLGQSADHLRGRPVSDFTHAQDAATMLTWRRDLLETPSKSLIRQLRLRDIHEEPIQVRLSASALTDPDGRVVRMVAVVEDITHQLRLAEADRQRDVALAESRAKTDFVSRMSHELRTPLNAMIGFAQLLGLDRDPELRAHQRDWVQQIQRAGWHLLELINETLDLARIESGHVQLTLVPLALSPVLKNCREMLETQARQRGIRFRESLQSPDLAIIGDSARFTQVMSNLLSNAVKYNRQDGEVTVTALRMAGAEPGTEVVEIQVSDTGIGMTDQQVASLFQPYNRLGRETSDIEGTGIGLVICRRLCALMHASLEVESRSGVGTVFTLRVPAAASATAPAARQLETSTAPYRNRRVHYIEDNEVNVEVMRGILMQRPQIEFETSSLGAAGLASMSVRPPDLLLLDMQLPDLDGMEILARMKTDRALEHVPVVIVSADATPAHIQDALDAGALHYVTKPIEVAAFLQSVDNILDRGQTQW